jgi:hypothetical protein
VVQHVPKERYSTNPKQWHSMPPSGRYNINRNMHFYSFVEAFVNGIGLDHLYTQSDMLTQNEKDILTGKQNDNYLSLEKKIEKFHQIIRPDKKQVFNSTNKKLQKEPFLTFFNECKEIRNSSVHYSPLKAKIVLPPLEWLEKVKNYAQKTLSISKVFWNACYINRKFPDYIDLLCKYPFTQTVFD